MANLRIYNSLSRKKEDFVPLQSGHVKMYVCGPTVYNFLHVGNFRNPVFFNLVRNWLESEHGLKVTFVYNFTDVDDRIIHRAQEEGKTPLEISERYIAEFKQDFQSLGLRTHDVNPKVTETMDEILHLVSHLIEKKKAYLANGDVMFSIRNFPTYGHLSGRNPDELIAGARVEVDEKKENPLDFALWKSAKPGEPHWESPWGKGRPGWHIECSAMVFKHLGEQIDIHGGGTDLIFPHHENEVAQSEGSSGKPFVKYWMHVSMLNFSGQKMSKSLGNFITMRDFLKIYHSEIYKWMILSVHYRTVSDFGDDAVHRSIANLARVYSALSLAESLGAIINGSDSAAVAQNDFTKVTEPAWQKVVESLNDDFNTPEAFAALFEVIRMFNSQHKRGMKTNPIVQAKAQTFVNFIRRFGQPMAMFQQKPAQFLRELDDLLLEKMSLQRQQVEILVGERTQARQGKDFKRSDELRDQLMKMGISVSDTPEGTFWEVTK